MTGVYTGEVVWGQLAALVSGMKSGMRDKENLGSPHPSSSSPWRFRVAARPGIWHVRCRPLPISRFTPDADDLDKRTTVHLFYSDNPRQRSTDTPLPLTSHRLPHPPRRRRPYLGPLLCTSG